MKAIFTDSEIRGIVQAHFNNNGLAVTITEIEIVSDDAAWIEKTIKPLVKAGELISAIREVRAKKGYSLVDAKEFVEKIKAGLDKA